MNAHNEQQYPASAVVKQNLTTQPAAAQLGDRLDRAYAERNALAIAFAKAALAAGWRAGRGYDDDQSKDWAPQWRHVVYVDLPDGRQVSWHMAPAEVELLDRLPQYAGEWNGEFTARDPSWCRFDAPAAAQEAVAIEVPNGAIFNGNAYADRLETYGFECEAGPLTNCNDWVEFRRCFNHLADWAYSLPPIYATTVTAAPADPEHGHIDPSWSLHDRVEFALRDAGFDLGEAAFVAEAASAAEESTPAAPARLTRDDAEQDEVGHLRRLLRKARSVALLCDPLVRLGQPQSANSLEAMAYSLIHEIDAAIPAGPVDASTAAQGMDPRHDARNWGDALNEASWTFLDACPEKSSLLFNNCKPALRAAILKYLERIDTCPVTAAPGIDLTPFRVPVEFWRDVWRGAEDHFGEPDSRVAEADRLLALIDASHKGGSDCETCNGRGIFDTDGNGPEEGHRCGGTAVRTRNHDWIDTNSMTPLYSFQVYADGRWRPPHIDGKPLLFKTEAERDKARAEARAKKANSHGAGVHHD